MATVLYPFKKRAQMKCVPALSGSRSRDLEICHQRAAFLLFLMHSAVVLYSCMCVRPSAELQGKSQSCDNSILLLSSSAFTCFAQ